MTFSYMPYTPQVGVDRVNSWSKGSYNYQSNIYVPILYLGVYIYSLSYMPNTPQVGVVMV